MTMPAALKFFVGALAMSTAIAAHGISRHNTTLSDSVASDSYRAAESLFPEASRSLSMSHFTWGIETGASVDMTGNDMSTFNADVIIGYKNATIRTIGVSAGVHRSFGNGDNYIPVCFVFRSSFRSRPSLFFLNFKAGYSFNTISDSPAFGDVCGTLGVGINLAMSRHFMSHIIIGYEFRHFTENHKSLINLTESNVSLAKLSFGVNF